MSKWRPTDVYSYGYQRAEVLSGFINGVFLIFVAFSIAVEAIERIKEPPEVHSGHLIPVAVGGLLINLIGIFFFHDAGHHHHHHEEEEEEHHHDHDHEKEHHHHHHGHDHNHGNDNIKGVFLHVLADTLGSVGVIISSVIIHVFIYIIIVLWNNGCRSNLCCYNISIYFNVSFSIIKCI